MSVRPSSPAGWKWCALVSAAMVLLSLAPQVHLWLVRGSEWRGAYASVQGDEFLYSAYINALIDGRPRLNDPFAGRDSTAISPLPESPFSIQFIPPLIIASLARVGGASAASTFIVLIGVAALGASLSVAWLLACVTGDRELAAAGVFVVLCFGAVAAGQGLIGILLKRDVIFLGLPFVRRYQPAAVFPLFFVFCALLWLALTSRNRWPARLHSALAGVVLAVLVFSYLFLWTAAAAWLSCLALLWLYLRPRSEKWPSIELFIITAAITICALLPYAYLVSHRATSLDAAQTLTFTHRPDLFRIPEVIGVLILIALFTALRKKQIERSEPRVIFAASFAFLPLILFNQQLLTGRSVQPYHFEGLVANYAELISLVILAAFLRPRITNRTLGSIAAFCFLWGAVEVGIATFANFKSNVIADEMIPVLLRLKELSHQDSTSAGRADHASTLVFSSRREVMAWLPTWTSQGTLLGMGTLDFGSASQEERKEFLYIHLYYSGADATRLRALLSQTAGDFFMSHYARIAIFGHERVVPLLGFDSKPIRSEEIEQEVKLYQSYVDSFSREKALLRPFTYVVAAAETPSDFSRIDRWYQRDAGEKIDGYYLYRVRLRTQETADSTFPDHGTQH
jgi:hypothetical protein